MRSPIAEETAPKSEELPMENTKSEAAAEVLPGCSWYLSRLMLKRFIAVSLRKVQKEPKKSKKSSSSSSSTSSDKKRKKTPQYSLFFSWWFPRAWARGKFPVDLIRCHFRRKSSKSRKKSSSSSTSSKKLDPLDEFRVDFFMVMFGLLRWGEEIAVGL